ncbi:MAG: hypothetical protein RLZZ347_376 [Candidatus Parcubacteria bacterium]|jgi:ribosomal protein L35
MKTNKSYSKRIKVTKNGKLVARVAGQGHFNAKESGSNQMAKNRSVLIHMSNKAKSRFLPSSH